MKATTASVLVAALAATAVEAVPVVDTRFPYDGPAVPIGDWIDNTVNGNGKGFVRLVEPPAVTPKSSVNFKLTNNINVISLSYVPSGMNVHFQTPFGIGQAPKVHYGTDSRNLNQIATGYTHTYDRTPSCSLIKDITQCSEFFHEIQLHNLRPATTYYYQIPGGNGTTPSDVLSFTTALAAGDHKEFSVAVLNDLGYTNGNGTHDQILKAVEEGTAFAWHGGDISYADNWATGLSPGQGTPRGGELSVMYEPNWDLWQNWMSVITTKVPYMVMPGNHEAACAEGDATGNVLTAYLNDDETNTTVPTSGLNYYSCPPSQRNYTAYQHRFRMPGSETGGVGNFWYSFDYGLAHFVSFDGETDFPNSPESPFQKDVTAGETLPTRNQTGVIDSGPFGAVEGSLDDNKSYEQLKWLERDLARVDRKKTPWVFAMTHRPMYSSTVSSYQADVRAAFEALLLKYGVDAYVSGHIHWYERMYPMGLNGTIDHASVVNNNTYRANKGKSMLHIVNGQAGNLENHSTLSPGQSVLPITANLDTTHFGFTKLTVVNSTASKWEFIHGDDGTVGDYVWLLKQ